MRRNFLRFFFSLFLPSFLRHICRCCYWSWSWSYYSASECSIYTILLSVFWAVCIVLLLFSVLSQTNTNHLLYVRNFCCSSAFKRNETCMRYYDFRLLAYAHWFSFLSISLVGALFLRMPLALFLMVDKPNGMYKYIIAIIRLFYRWIMTWHLSVSRAPLLIALL